MKAVSIALLAGMVGCAVVQPAPAADAATFKESVGYSFCPQQSVDCSDGSFPEAGLIEVNGVLYGTTYYGGTGPNDCSQFFGGCGTVFAVDPKTGAETVLHSFTGGTDGTLPEADPIEVKGRLYGTTSMGGKYGGGTVFALDPDTGKEEVLHAFGGAGDGSTPYGGLIEVKGMLYGMTYAGGTTDFGSVFSLDRSTGAETLLYSFCAQQDCTDGANPEARLIDVGGILYGTTAGGGGSDFFGTVFSLNPKTGAETVLHSFTGGDGEFPSGLIEVDGVLYGTASQGGSGGECGTLDGCGTVFSVDLGSGAFTRLHSFAGSGDGAYPFASLIAEDGRLYGSTLYGGGSGCYGFGCGTVFSLDPGTGAETVIYSFSGLTDGGLPWTSLVPVKSTLYGTTSSGGNFGKGTVFTLRKTR